LIAWILSIWALPAARKFIVYGGAILAISLFLRWYGNTHYYRGEQQGRASMAREMERQKKAEWEEKESELAVAAEDIAIEKRTIEAAIERMNRDRAVLSRTLRDGLVQIQRERMKDYESAAAVTDDRLWDAIRAISAELATDP
jgi:hypothetical protein